jgi:hypothetical protein
VAHILLKQISSVASTSLYDDVDLYIFSSDKWYLGSFIQMTNGVSDIECGTYDNDIVEADYGRF